MGTMITVKLTPKKEIKRMEWERGTTVEDILKESRWTSSSVAIFVNGTAASKDRELEDGDEVVLVPIVGGG